MIPNHPHCIISKSNEDWVVLIDELSTIPKLFGMLTSKNVKLKYACFNGKKKKSSSLFHNELTLQRQYEFQL